jgi:hypothetical protein
MTSETKETKPSKPAAKPAPKPGASERFSALGLGLLAILVPGLLAGLLVGWGFAALNMWQYGETLAQVVFAVAMVAVALLLGVVLDSFLAPMRKRSRAKGVRWGTGPLARLVILVLGCVLVPLGLFAGVQWLPVTPQGTAMQALMTVAEQQVKLAPPDEVGGLALQTKNPATKILSIQVLRGFQSPEALNQLVRLASEDRAALADAGVAAELSRAIAAYGAAAKQPLFALFTSIDPTAAASLGGGSDLYERYFAGSFASLGDELASIPADPAVKEAQAARLQAAQVQLKEALSQLQPEAAALPAGSDLRAGFVLRTFLAMDLAQDADLLSFAKSTAANTAYSPALRGDALLLVGKLGSPADLDGLYPYLKDSSELLQTRALQAITAIQAKESGASNP